MLVPHTHSNEQTPDASSFNPLNTKPRPLPVHVIKTPQNKDGGAQRSAASLLRGRFQLSVAGRGPPGSPRGDAAGVAEAAAKGPGHGAAGVRPGAGGRRPQPPHAVPLHVPQ